MPAENTVCDDKGKADAVADEHDGVGSGIRWGLAGQKRLRANDVSDCVTCEVRISTLQMPRLARFADQCMKFRTRPPSSTFQRRLRTCTAGQTPCKVPASESATPRTKVPHCATTYPVHLQDVDRSKRTADVAMRNDLEGDRAGQLDENREAGT